LRERTKLVGNLVDVAGIDPMRQHLFFGLPIGTAFCAALLALAGCATSPRTEVRIAPRFYGILANVNERNYNWWEISAKRVVNYGVALDNGKCGAYNATIIAGDAIDVPFGNAGVVHMGIIDNELFFVAPHGVARHKRVSAAAICQLADGTYFDRAPYAASSK
jgi:hypothetical protein